MNYIYRHMENRIMELSQSYSAILLTGPRQAGKTTMLRSLAQKENKGREYVSLDDLSTRDMAKNDPALFLQIHKPPVLIDEVQYAPELFTYIKIHIDEHHTPGEFWMTGSQIFRLMKGVQESLAGRVALLHMSPMSQREIIGADCIPFTTKMETLLTESKKITPVDTPTLFERIWRGSMPGIVSGLYSDRNMYYSSYISTYVERDVQSLSQVGNKSAFVTLMRSAALRTGQQLVYNDLARDAGVSPKTAAAWVSVLEASGIVSLLQPYHSNSIKRLAKSPKLYFLDTGFCCWLAGCRDAAELARGPLAGAMLETWVYGQLLRAFTNAGMEPRLYYFRNHDGAEVDFLIEDNMCLYPIEVKLSNRPVPGDLKGVRHIPAGLNKIHPGMVFCTSQKWEKLTPEGMASFPISAL